MIYQEHDYYKLQLQLAFHTIWQQSSASASENRRAMMATNNEFPAQNITELALQNDIFDWNQWCFELGTFAVMWT